MTSTPGTRVSMTARTGAIEFARIDLALGSAKVAAHRDLCPVGEQPLEGRNACPQTKVIGDLEATGSRAQRRIQVGPNQHPPTDDRWKILQRGKPRSVRRAGTHLETPSTWADAIVG